MRRLGIPELIEHDPEAVEILSAWAQPNDEIGFVTTEFPVSDPAGLGIFFADLARHYFKIAGISSTDWPKALRRVAEAVTAEADAQELGLRMPSEP